MKKSIINVIKYNKWIRRAFTRIGSYPVKLISPFIRVIDNRVLFLSFGGRQYSDSPKALYEAMQVDPFFKGYEFIWAFNDLDKHESIKCKKVKTDTLEYFKTALSSRVWITNTSICRGGQFKRKKNLCVNPWHGSPLKKLNTDSNPKYREQIDIGCCQNELDKKVFLRIFNVKKEDLLECDLPRNDALLRFSKEDIEKIKKELGVSIYKKVLLYMPTYREYNQDENRSLFFTPPITFEKWEKELGSEYVLLVRFHHFVEKAMTIPNNNFVLNVSSYESLNELYAIADILISDYSSSYVDYSILQRPMLCFGYDYDYYKAVRGFEVDFANEIPCEIDKDEDHLIEHIKKMNYEECSAKASLFHIKYSPHAGHATETVLAELKRRLEKQ